MVGISFFLVFLLFFPPGSSPAAPIFGQQCGGQVWLGRGGRGQAKLVFCVYSTGGLFGSLCFTACSLHFFFFFTEFVLEGVYIFWGSAALVDWALLSLAPPSKKIAEKAVCATPKRATLKNKSAPPEKRCKMSFCHQNKPVLRPKRRFESILIRVGRLVQFLVSFPNSKGNKRLSYWPLICFFVFWSKSSLFW